MRILWGCGVCAYCLVRKYVNFCIFMNYDQNQLNQCEGGLFICIRSPFFPFVPKKKRTLNCALKPRCTGERARLSREPQPGRMFTFFRPMCNTYKLTGTYRPYEVVSVKESWMRHESLTIDNSTEKHCKATIPKSHLIWHFSLVFVQVNHFLAFHWGILNTFQSVIKCTFFSFFLLLNIYMI